MHETVFTLKYVPDTGIYESSLPTYYTEGSIRDIAIALSGRFASLGEVYRVQVEGYYADKDTFVLKTETYLRNIKDKEGIEVEVSMLHLIESLDGPNDITECYAYFSDKDTMCKIQTINRRPSESFESFMQYCSMFKR